MSKSYLPSREAELVTWVNNFGALLSAAPGSYGLQPEDA